MSHIKHLLCLTMLISFCACDKSSKTNADKKINLAHPLEHSAAPTLN